MDALARFAEVEALLHAGRRVGRRSLVDRETVLAALADARTLLEAELREARDVLRDRDAIVAEGRREAERLRAEARAERARRGNAAGGADDGVSNGVSDAEAQRLRAEASEFAERSLAELEAVLQRALSGIGRARDRLYDEGGTLGADELRAALTEE